MDIMQIDEQWLELDKHSQKRDTIVAISNTGKYRKRNGEVGVLSLRQRGTGKGDRKTAKRCYHIIAENFLITVRRPDQNQIDHITHHPDGYEVNDVRNLRWCNKYENDNFEEAKANKSGVNAPWYGKTGENTAHWKGDNAGPSGLYHRALKLYRAGKLTEDEFQPYKKMISQYIKDKKAKRATSSAL
jgi:hypothetical protein